MTMTRTERFGMFTGRGRPLKSALVMRARRAQIGFDLAGKRRGRDNADERAPAQDPASEGPIVTHIEGDLQTPAGVVPELLRGVPDPRANVGRDLRLELELHPLRRPGVDPERGAADTA